MRVLTILLDVPIPATTGLHLRQVAILRAVRELGHESHALVFATEDRSALPPDLARIVVVHDAARRVEYSSLSAARRVLLRLSMLRSLVGLQAGVYPFSIPYDLADARRRILEAAERTRADAVILPTILLHHARVLSDRGITVIADAPDIVSQLTSRVMLPAIRHPWMLPGLLLNHVVTLSQERSFFKYCSEIWASTEAEARTLVASVPSANVVVAGNAIDERAVEMSPYHAGGPIGLIANFSLSVNAEAARFLVEDILPVLRRRIPTARVALAGAGMPRRLADRLSAAQGVEILGSVPDSSAFIASCSVMALTVRTRAGVPLKLIESMAVGRPVVATAELVSGLDLENGEDVLVAATARDAATHLSTILADSQLASTLARHARHRFEKDFSFRAMTSRLRSQSILAS